MRNIPPRASGPGPVGKHALSQESSAVEGSSPRWRLKKGALAIAALALAGALVFLYPTTASWLAQYDQSKVVVDLDATVQDEAPQYRVDALTAAREYNTSMISGAVLPANERKPEGSGSEVPDPLYGQLLNGDGNGAMGRLRVDSVAIDLPIYHGTEDATLEKGVGHLQGTSLPVGGPSTHAVLTAHRGLAGATLFDRLDGVVIGDNIKIEVFGETLVYRVTETKVVAPEDTESLLPRYDEDLVTLVTCTPLGINSHRILVTGERVLPTPTSEVQSAGAPPEIPGTPWWVAGILGTVAALGLYVWSAGRPRRQE